MKIPSHNEELEREILGTAFVSSEAFDRVVRLCKPYYFYRDKYREIFLAMKKMRDSNLQLDLISINVQMGNEWAHDLGVIHHYGITDVMLDQHISQLKELSNQRKLMAVVQLNDFEEIKDIIDAIESDSVPQSAIIGQDQIEEGIYNYYEKGGEKGVSTGWKALDEFYTISKGQITIVTGIPSHGKSEWLDAMAINLSMNHNWKFLFFSPENFPVYRHVRKLMEKHSGFPFFKGFVQRLQTKDLKININWINEHFYFLNPDPRQRTIEFLLTQIYDIDGFILDPWNELESRRPDGMTETEYISQCLMKVKATTVHKNIHVWIVAHPTKLQKTERGVYPVPTPYDISGSANWRNKADNCISIYRENMEHRISVHVQKVRFKDNGKPGVIELDYDPVSGRFSE
jgi:twinkle protein